MTFLPWFPLSVTSQDNRSEIPWRNVPLYRISCLQFLEPHIKSLGRSKRSNPDGSHRTRIGILTWSILLSTACITSLGQDKLSLFLTQLTSYHLLQCKLHKIPSRSQVSSNSVSYSRGPRFKYRPTAELSRECPWLTIVSQDNGKVIAYIIVVLATKCE